MNKIKIAYQEMLAGLFTMVVCAPAVLLLVAAITLLVKLCYHVVLWIWG